MFKRLFSFLKVSLWVIDIYWKASGFPLTFWYCLNCKAHHYYIHWENDKTDPFLCCACGCDEKENIKSFVEDITCH